MAMEMVEQNKRYLKKRINEIIEDYLFDDDESYCRVQFVSNDDILQIGKYKDEEFTSIMTTQKFFDPDCDEEK